MKFPTIVDRNLNDDSSRDFIKQTRELISAIARFRRINAINDNAGIALLTKKDKHNNLIFKYRNIFINNYNQSFIRNFLKFRLYKQKFKTNLNFLEKKKKVSNIVNKITFRVRSPFFFSREKKEIYKI